MKKNKYIRKLITILFLLVPLTVFAPLTETRDIAICFDGGGSTISTGIYIGIVVDYKCTIQQATLTALNSGSIVIDIWKDTYANYPPTVAKTITASAKPTLSSAIQSKDSILTGWTTQINAGDILYFNVDSCTTITNVTLTLKVKTY